MVAGFHLTAQGIGLGAEKLPRDHVVADQAMFLPGRRLGGSDGVEMVRSHRRCLVMARRISGDRGGIERRLLRITPHVIPGPMDGGVTGPGAFVILGLQMGHQENFDAGRQKHVGRHHGKGRRG